MVPKLTAEQRRAALDKGMQIRIKRAEYKAKLKNGLMSIEQFFEFVPCDLVGVDSLTDTERGTDGFGSTGID